MPARKKPAEQEDLFNTPGSLPGGEFVKLNDLEDCLLVLQATTDEEKTEKFDNGEGTYIEARCLVVEGAAELANEWHDMWVFPVAVRGQLKRSYPKPVVGILGKGTAQKGKSAPWLLMDPTDEQQAAARNAYVKVEAGF